MFKLKIQYPDLPISRYRSDIQLALQNNNVLILAGETGSGKSTQLSKMCLELWPEKRIAHTQPRRIAASSVANRVASELGVSLGSVVGYKVRFSDQTNTDTAIKFLTDGMLLAEIQQDISLQNYDIVIVDEAHERSLNIDLLLGYLKKILQKRTDLKVIVTSATIDIKQFSVFF